MPTLEKKSNLKSEEQDKPKPRRNKRTKINETEKKKKKREKSMSWNADSLGRPIKINKSDKSLIWLTEKKREDANMRNEQQGVSPDLQTLTVRKYYK